MALAGLGQCAIIVRATPGASRRRRPRSTLVDYDYADLDTFLDDQRAVARDAGAFDHLGGRVATQPGGRRASA